MKYRICGIILLTLIIATPFAVADETNKRTKIESIVKLWNLDEELGGYHDACVASYNLGSPEILVKDNPDHFYGIRPGSPNWPSILAIWNKYVETSCGFMNAKSYKKTLVDSLSSQLTENNVDDVLSFYKAKSGMAYLKAQNAGSLKMQKYYKDITSVAAKTAYDTYMSELNKITSKMQQGATSMIADKGLDYKLIVAIYAAVISTIAVLWNIINALSAYRGNLSVKHSFAISFVVDVLTGPEKGQVPYLVCIVTNKGKSIRHIKRPEIEISRPIDGEKTFAPLKMKDTMKFPKQLNHGEVFEMQLNLFDIENHFLNKLKPGDKLWFNVYDTLGKKYRSDKFTAATLTEYVKGARQE